MERLLYRHYKGGLYEVMGYGLHTETEEKLVFYRSCSNDKLWARPHSMFFEKVEVNGARVDRFEFLGRF